MQDTPRMYMTQKETRETTKKILIFHLFAQNVQGLYKEIAEVVTLIILIKTF